MVFKGTRGPGLARSLFQAAVWGYPGAEGVFALSGEGDLRPAIYSPESTFTETAALILSTLFTEDIDPILAERLAERAFPVAPPVARFEEEILVVDLAGGVTGSSADYGASLFAGLLASHARSEERRLVVALPGPWGSALIEAGSTLDSVDFLLLCTKEAVRGIKSQRLAREGGNTILLGLEGDRNAHVEFLRSLCGRRLAGREVVVAGPGHPVEFAANLILQAATFAELRRGAAGEIFAVVPSDSGLGLASGLWAWGLGLPLTGFILPHFEGLSAPSQEPEFGELVERFGAERSGLIGSLLSGQDVSEDEARTARDELAALGGPLLDRSSSIALAAAKRHLVPELRGHSHIVVSRREHPYWDRSPAEGAWATPAERPAWLAGALADARLDATIEADLGRLEDMLQSLLGA